MPAVIPPESSGSPAQYLVAFFAFFSRGCGLYLRAPGFDKNLANEEAEDARDAMAQGGAQAHAAEKPLRGWHGVDTRQPPASLHRRLPV